MAEIIFGLWIYIQLLCQVAGETATVIDFLHTLVVLPRLSMEFLLAICLLSLIPFIVKTGNITRLIIFICMIGLNSFLVVDQLFFEVFSQHLSLAATEGRTPNIYNLYSSFTAQVSATTWINGILGGIAAFSVFPQVGQDQTSPQGRKRYKVIPACIVGWLIVSFLVPLPALAPNFNIVTTLFTGTGSFFSTSSPTGLNSDLYHPVVQQPSANSPRRTVDVSSVVSKQPNIIFIVLESVGTQQLMPDGQFDKVTTPFLASLAQQSILFNNIYTYFPSTARSHIPMLTGGNSITWGSVFDEFNYPYTGKNIVQDLKKQGYITGFFSSGDLSYENRYAFYKSLPFHKLEGFNTFDRKEKQLYTLNSWGVSEEYAWDKALQWLNNLSTSEKPFFLHYMTVATHHPYDIPKEATPLYKENSLYHRYLNALHYTDDIIKKMFSDLEENDLTDNTIVIITGDHGEAFGRKHPGNITHKNYLYEENIRTFLLITRADGKLLSPLIDDTPGSVADIAPTIGDLTGIKTSYDYTASLLSPEYKPRLNFFHKGTFPHQWGVRDENWKFIENIRDGNPQLYNLAKDPAEQNNLARQYPALTATYHERVQEWFINQNHAFRQSLAGYPDIDEALVAADLDSPGPKSLKVGLMQNGRFSEKNHLTKNDAIVSRIRLVPYEEDTTLAYWWISPSGNQIYISHFTIKKGWTTARLPMPKERFKRFPSGAWQLALKKEGQELIRKSFTIQ